MTEFLSFLLVISSGLFFSGLLRRFDLPYVTALILAGIAVGPFGLGLFSVDPAVSLIGAIGAIFLMFMAGLETHITSLSEIESASWILLILNSTLPFITGLSIGLVFGYSFSTSVVIGILFISSSVAVLLPQLEKTGFVHKRLGRTLLTSVILEDIGSLLLLSFVLQSAVPKTGFPVYIYFGIILLSIAIMKIVFPRARELYSDITKHKDEYESELRFLFVMLIGTAIFFEALGMHAIVAGFIVGMVLSGTIKTKKVLVKLRTISYGVFIPTFFVIIGANVDLGVFIGLNKSLTIMVAIVLALVLSKTLSGFIAGKLGKFNNKESVVIGLSTTPQLSTTLAAAFAAQQFNLLDSTLITSLIALSVVTTLLPPLALNYITKEESKRE